MFLHHSQHRLRRSALAVLIATLVAPLALQLTASADDDGDAVAGPGVARLSVVDGRVAIGRGNTTAAVDAVVNAPLLGGDYVTTGPQSRAEIQFDGTTVVRLGENVQLRMSRVDEGRRDVQLAAGTIDVRLLRGTDGRTTIDTPSITVEPRSSGSYRVSVTDDGATLATARSGHASVDLPGGSRPLETGSTIVAQGPASNPDIVTRDEIGYDAFDAFNRDRDRAELAVLANSPYVDPAIGGVSDLGAYGSWVDDGSYGHVWLPANVAAGWAPYRDGNWAWANGYGWTWVAAEPWGWAPYHYGRWYYSASYSRWAWFPPAPAVYRPAWSPALVGFVGLSIGAVSVGIGFGHIGWVPLAPYEAFHPWWGPHATAIVNTYNVTNVYNGNVTHYRNVQYNGLSSVSVDNFRAGRFAHPTIVTAQQYEEARPVAMRGALPVGPAGTGPRFTQPATSFAGPTRSTMTDAAAPSYARQSYAQPAERQAPSYAQPSYRQPTTYAQPSYRQPATDAQPAVRQQPTYAQPSYRQQPANDAQPSYRRPPTYAQPQRSAPQRSAGGESRPAQRDGHEARSRT